MVKRLIRHLVINVSKRINNNGGFHFVVKAKREGAVVFIVINTNYF